MGRKQCDAVDLAKWICSWLVVYIHCKPFSTCAPLLDVAIAQGAARIAVPLFYSVSALLLFRKMQGNRQDLTVLRRFALRILLIYAAWAGIYLLYHVFANAYNNGQMTVSLSGLADKFLFEGVHYHLWYLIATIYALPVVYLLWKKGTAAIWVACLGLHFLGCMDKPYGVIAMFESPYVKWFQEELSLVYDTLVHAIPLMCMGLLCLQNHTKQSAKQWGKHTLIWLAVYVFELGMLLWWRKESMVAERLLSGLPLCYCLVNWLFTVNFCLPARWLQQVLRDSSLWIYCSHPLFLLLWDWIFAYRGIMRFGAVCLLSFVSSAPYVLYKMKKSARKAVKKEGLL